MRKFILIACTVSFLVSTSPSLAYEVTTHEDMSEAAAFSSVLAKPETLSALGLTGGMDDPKLIFPNSKGNAKTIKFLIRDGSRFEDSLLRPVNHFFDSISGDALLPLVAKPSPTWALEDKGSIVFPLLQRYSFADARDYLYKALTLADETERKKHFGLTFETLGRVIHHIQDMAQPQHVRLDPHLKLSDADKPDWFFEEGSRYETYTKSLGGNLPFNTYAPVNSKDDLSFLTTARSFWHTAQGGGIGLAEFTNSNFVSAGTNFDTDRYPNPRLAQATAHDGNANSLLQREGLTVPPECLPPNQPCFMTFFRSRVQDNYRSTASKDNDYTSTLSIFDQDLQVQNKRAFSLNRFNFIAAHEFLIPRAVAYSAGLIDYFFRGKLEVEDVTFTDSGISLRVKNAIDPQKTPAWQNELLYAKTSNGSAGSFTVAFDYQDSSGKTQYGVSNTIPVRATDTLAPGQISSDVYDFALTIPSEAKDVNYRLVFRGKLGQEEDAVAVGPVEPISGFLAGPSYVPTDGITGERTIYRVGSDWKLSQETGRQAGSIDWKGWYVNGRPTKVLTWAGPATRYFPQTYDPNSFSHLGVNGYLGLYSNRVYQNGELFAVAPRAVLGAALMRDSAGNEWVVVICRDGMADVVYRRPNVKSNSTSGWQQIGRFTHDPSALNPANIPWFFNSSGTEAQTMRSGRLPSSKPWLFRLKINIQDFNTTFSNEGNLEGHLVEHTDTASCSASIPSDPNPCASVTGCSGGTPEPLTSEGHNVTEVKPRGGFTIAVDYIDDKPVFATYIREGVIKYTVDTSFQQLFKCVPYQNICSTNVAEERRDAHYEETRDQVEKITMSDYGDIILISLKGSHSTNYSEVNLVRSGIGTSNMVITYGHLRYLDLRYGLYSIRSQVTHIQGPAPVNDVTGSRGRSYVMPYMRHQEQAISFLNQEFPVHEAPEPAQSYAVQPYDVATAAIPCDSTKTYIEQPLSPYFLDLGQSHLYDPLYIDFTRRGNRPPISVAVDSNKNLFVSEAKMDAGEPPNNVGYFNYLTGGDPGVVIPYAPDGAHYDPIRVIK